jgi:hypothetical protein
MKFSNAWANLLTQNAVLRVVLIGQFALITVLTVSVIRLAAQDPLIIERGIQSKIIEASESSHTEQEVMAVIEKGLLQRFSSKEDLGTQFLNPGQLPKRDKEQSQLGRQRLKQYLCLGDIEISKESGVLANTIRVIQAGKILSAFSTPLSMSLESVPRSFVNPYGLRISKIEEAREEGQSDK